MDEMLKYLLVGFILINYLNENYVNSTQEGWTNEEIQHLFLKKDHSNCKPLQDEILYRNIEEFLNNFEFNVQNAIKENQLHLLPAKIVETLPTSFLHLLPIGSLSNISGETLARWGLQVKAFGKSSFWDRLTLEIKNCEKSKAFLNSIPSTRTSPHTAQILGLALPRWWQHCSQINFADYQLTLSLNALQHLPVQRLLAESANNTSDKYIYYLRLWKSELPETRHPFRFLNQVEARVWSYITLTLPSMIPLNNWGIQLLISQGFFLKGATPYELLQLNHFKVQEFSKLIHQAEFNKPQIRAAYQAMIDNNNPLDENSQNDLIMYAIYLNTNQVQKLYHIMNRDIFIKLKNLGNSIINASPLTAFEIAKCLENESIRRFSHLKVPSMWEKLESLGPWIFVKFIPEIRMALSLEEAHPLNKNVLLSLHSQRLTFGQVRALTQDGKNITINSDLLAFKEFAQAIPLSQVVFLHEGQLSQNSRERLTLYLTKKNPALSAAIASITHRNIAAGIDILRAQPRLLMSPRILEILPIKDLKIISKYMINFFPPHSNVAEHPIPLLSYALNFIRENVEWKAEKDFLLSPLLLGLSCEQMDNIRIMDFIPFISSYNSVRKLFFLPFPKETQICWKNFLQKYLLMKMKLNRPCSNKPLLENLNIAEIRAIEGYVFTSISINAINASGHNTMNILETIGKVSHEELLTSANITHLQGLANLFADKLSRNHDDRLNVSAVLRLGQLVHFLNSKYLNMIEYSAFRLWVESQELNSGGRSLCHGMIYERDSWVKLIKEAFGPANTWTTELMYAIGDLMLVLPDSVVEQIPTINWRSAIDIISEQSFYARPIRSSFKTETNINFYQLCMEILETEDQRIIYQKAIIQLSKHYLNIASSQVASLFKQDPILFHKLQPNKGHQNEVLHEIDNSPLTTFKKSMNNSLPVNEHVTNVNNSDMEYLPTTTHMNILETTIELGKLPLNDKIDLIVNLTQINQTHFKESLINKNSETTTDMNFSQNKNNNLISSNISESLSTTSSESDNINNIKEDFYYDEMNTPSIEENVSSKEISENKNSSFLIKNDGAKNYSSTFNEIGNFLSSLFMDNYIKDSNTTKSKRSYKLIENDLNMYGKTLQNQVRRSEIEDVQPTPPTPSPPTPPTNSVKLNTLLKSSKADLIFSNEVMNKGPRNKALNCHAIRTVGPLAAFGLNVREIMILVGIGELDNCLETLGKLEMLPYLIRKLIVSHVKEEVLKVQFDALGGLIEGIDESFIPKLNLSIYNFNSLDRLQLIASYAPDKNVLRRATRVFLSHNEPPTSELPPMTSSAITMVLGLGIGCTLTSAERKQWIKGELLPRNWPASQFSLCPPIDCLLDFAMMRRINFEMESWTSLDLYSLGIHAAAIPEKLWLRIPPEAYPGLTPQALLCLPIEIQEIISKTHQITFSSLPELNIAWLTKRELPLEEVPLIDMEKLPEHFVQSLTRNECCISVPNTFIIYLFIIYFLIKYNF